MSDANYSFTWLKNEENTKELREALSKLTGNDFERAERAELTAGNNAPLLSWTKSFQARIAAKALGVPAPEIRNLPIKEYNAITHEVFNFLYGTSEESVLEKLIEG